MTKFRYERKNEKDSGRSPVKPVLSGHRIKRTVAEVPKFISLIYFT